MGLNPIRKKLFNLKKKEIEDKTSLILLYMFSNLAYPYPSSSWSSSQLLPLLPIK